MRNTCRILAGQSEEKRTLRRSRRRCEDIIKIDLECGLKVVDWIHLPQDTRVYPKVSELAAWSENCK
jgi:hypothetical protein